jgi:hypothetical protein
MGYRSQWRSSSGALPLVAAMEMTRTLFGDKFFE